MASERKDKTEERQSVFDDVFEDDFENYEHVPLDTFDYLESPALSIDQRDPLFNALLSPQSPTSGTDPYVPGTWPGSPTSPKMSFNGFKKSLEGFRPGSRASASHRSSVISNRISNVRSLLPGRNSVSDAQFTTDLPTLHKKNKVFFVYIMVSVFSFVLTLPFQIFLVYNGTTPTKWNKYESVLSLNATTLILCSVVLLLTKFYQLVLTIQALISKNTILALYLLIYLCLTFVPSTIYIQQYRKVLKPSTPNYEWFLVSFSIYFSIGLSALTIIIQTLLFTLSLRKELSWESFREHRISVQTRKVILNVQNYKAVTMLNVYFTSIHLALFFTSPVVSEYKALDLSSKIIVILIPINFLVLIYSYRGVNYGSRVSLILNMIYMMFFFVFSIIYSLMIESVIPFSVYNDDLTIVTDSSFFYKNTAAFRYWYAPMHFGLLLGSFGLSVNILRLFGKTEFSQLKDLLPVSSNKLVCFIFFVTNNRNDPSYREILKPSLENPLDEKALKSSALEVLMERLLGGNISFGIVCASVSLILQVVLLSWRSVLYWRAFVPQAVSWILVISCLYKVKLMKFGAKPEFRKKERKFKQFTLMVFSLLVSFISLIFLIGALFLTLTWNYFFVDMILTYVPFGDIQMYQAYAQLTKCGSISSQSYLYDPKTEQDYECRTQAKYVDWAQAHFLPHRRTAFVLVILALAFHGAWIIKMSLSLVRYSKIVHNAKSVHTDTKVIRESRDTKFKPTYYSLILFNCYLLLVVMFLVCTLDFSWYNFSDTMKHWGVYDKMVKINIVWRIVINCVFAIVVSAMIYYVKAKTFAKFCSVVGVLHFLWIGYLIYELYVSIFNYHLGKSTDYPIDSFYLFVIFAFCAALIISFLTTTIISVVYVNREKGKKRVIQYNEI